MAKSRFGDQDLRRELEGGQVQPFYLLHGDEDFTCQRTASWLLEKLHPEAPDFNVDQFSGEQFDLEHFIRVYQAYPMMAAHRLVVLRHCDKLTKDNAATLKEALDPAVPSSILVGVGAKLDMRRGLFQHMAKNGRAVEFRTPFENQLPQWVQTYARENGLRMAGDAVDLLVLYIGPNLRELASEIDKLALYVGDGQGIDRGAVEQAVGLWRGVNVFELADAVGHRQRDRAMALMRTWMEQGEEPGRAVAMIYRHFRLLLKARSLQQQAVRGNEMARQMGVSPFFLKNYLQQAQAYSTPLLWRGLEALLEADDQLKSRPRRQQGLIVDLLISRLCPPGRG